MLSYILVIIFATLMLALAFALTRLHSGAKTKDGLAAHVASVAKSYYDWKTMIFAAVVQYLFLAALCALIYLTGFGSILMYLVAISINMSMSSIIHRAICTLLSKSENSAAVMPA